MNAKNVMTIAIVALVIVALAGNVGIVRNALIPATPRV